MNDAIALFKRIRKSRYLDRRYTYKYAFVGIGNHSINNLYPALHYLNLPLKYIVSRSRQTADKVTACYQPITGTADYGKVLDDPEIGGIFICTNPSAHYHLVKSALEKQKNVFVEKPPCTSTNELMDLIEACRKNSRICLSGFQKRYSTCTSILKKRISTEKVVSYNYRFLTGSYPEGNVYHDLFIHPVDYVIYLFGEPELLSVAKTGKGKGQTSVFLQMRHKNIIGQIEISTQYAWNQAKEEIHINTLTGVYLMENHQTLVFKPKPATIFSIPQEKFFRTSLEHKYLFNGNDFLPVFQNNQLVSQGYFNEIKTFTDLCENRKGKNLSALETLEHTFKTIELLQK
jgi:virulence factor